MDEQKNIYPRAVSIMAFIAISVISFAQYERVIQEYQNLYIAVRIYFSITSFLFAVFFWKKELTDFVGSLFTINLLIYVLAMMWFMPLYEVAYIQVAIGTAFFRFRRSWLHSLLLGIGLASLALNYWLIDYFKWKLPPPEKADWIFSLIVLFAVTVCVQKFAVASFQKDADNLRRFGVIGRDAARLSHDLKGLLTSPMLILETFRNKSLDLPPDFYEKQIEYLIQDMDRVRETIKGINRLAATKAKIEIVDVNEILKNALHVLERRTARIKVTLPPARQIKGSPDHLQSIFFNLLINSIQAFESKGSFEDAKIEIFWKGTALVFVDNAGGLKSGIKNEGTGLGLELIRSDVQIMNAKFDIHSSGIFTTARIQFNRKSFG